MAVLVDQVRTRALEVTPNSSSVPPGSRERAQQLSTWCSHRRLVGLGFQNPCGGSQSSVTLVQGI